MWLASKYEEMFIPEVGDFAYITDNAFTKPQIREMERLILVGLNFEIGRPLPLHFLRRASKAGNVRNSTPMSWPSEQWVKGFLNANLNLPPLYLLHLIQLELGFGGGGQDSRAELGTIFFPRTFCSDIGGIKGI